VPLPVLRRLSVARGNVAGLLAFVTETALVFVLTLYLQEVFGYSPLAAGLSLAATFVGGVANLVVIVGFMDLDRDHRAVTPGLRKAVERRDESCVFAGCGAPTWWCDVHHLIHWLYGGETNLENSTLLCERHHQGPPRVPGRAPANGRWRTYRPDGTQILIGPLLHGSDDPVPGSTPRAPLVRSRAGHRRSPAAAPVRRRPSLR
jgi:hypothetical protein